MDAVKQAAPCPSAERERERLHAGIEELDLELSIADRSRLSEQLIQALFDGHAVAGSVNVAAVSGSRWLTINRHSKTYRVLPA